MGIVRFALRFPYTFYGLAALIVFLGISAIRVMPIDIFPEINIPVVNVIWEYDGLSTPEMEQRVSTYSQYAISTSGSAVPGMHPSSRHHEPLANPIAIPKGNKAVPFARAAALSDRNCAGLRPSQKPRSSGGHEAMVKLRERLAQLVRRGASRDRAA